jgi:hypothetical protein
MIFYDGVGTDDWSIYRDGWGLVGGDVGGLKGKRLMILSNLAIFCIGFPNTQFSRSTTIKRI